MMVFIPANQNACLEYRFRQFLDEQRDAVASDDDLLSSFPRKGPIAAELLRHCLNVLPLESTERQHAHIGQTRPWRVELGAEGDEQKHRQPAYPLDAQIDQLTRRCID